MKTDKSLVWWNLRQRMISGSIVFPTDADLKPKAGKEGKEMIFVWFDEAAHIDAAMEIFKRHGLFPLSDTEYLAKMGGQATG